MRFEFFEPKRTARECLKIAQSRTFANAFFGSVGYSDNPFNKQSILTHAPPAKPS